ncbi:S-adenosyl-L-methionine-dependent methyltransferase [Parathielavia appendiculata]|uniref:S-adenosyl-L-methionine-dependent methyltransferase n=1 Tax=Parathielavia appendiculata TaxID=2587402 RepID=A0AAN6U3J7_9PEZI|nr:S-adenosyl-L-methionine-dependent methyltransferase [Parathielavia appendiculata]
MMGTAAVREELQKFYQNAKAAQGGAFEEMLLENARNVSAPMALRMLTQMGFDKNTSTPIKLLENACGAGVVAPMLQQIIKPEVLKQSSILCGDFSEPMVELVKKRIESEGWVNTEAVKVDAQNTGLADASFTHVATNIGYHVVPDSEAALNESIRILKPGGVLGFTTMHREPGWFHEVREAFKSFPFEAPFEMPLQTTAWGQWSDVNWIYRTLVAKGLQDVEVDVFAFTSQVASANFFMSGFGMAMDWILNTCWSEELRKSHPKEEVRGLVKEFLEKKYGGEGWKVSWVVAVATGQVPSDG